MGFKLRKSVKIAPGVKINLSKSGVSTSIGGKGHSVNIGKRGVKTTVGIPGTGISHTSNITPSAKKKSSGCGTVAVLLLLLAPTTLWALFHLI